MSTHYIYPQWLRAKRDLIDKLCDPNVRASTTKIHDTVTAWFERHMFEVGCTVTTDIEREGFLVSGARPHELKKAAAMIGDELIGKALHVQEIRSGPHNFEVQRTYRVLVFGDPDPDAVGCGEGKP